MGEHSVGPAPEPDDEHHDMREQASLLAAEILRLKAERTEDFRAKSRLLKDNLTLRTEKAALTEALSLMHRRAQQNEGAAHRLERVRVGYLRDLKMQLAHTRFWKHKYREVWEGDQIRKELAEVKASDRQLGEALQSAYLANDALRKRETFWESLVALFRKDPR